MYDSILLPVDGSDHAEIVQRHAAELAQWADATVELLYVADTTRDSVTVLGDDVIDALVRYGEEVVAEAGEALDSHGVDYRTAVVQGRPAEAIVEQAAEGDHDLVVMPTHGRTGVSRFFLGSVTESVVRDADVPVLTARSRDERYDFPYERLLVPTDGSATANAAVDHALDLAESMDAAVDVLSVVNEASLGLDTRSTVILDELEAQADEAVGDVVARAEGLGIEARGHVARGSPPEAITARVDTVDADAVVMGTTGRSGLDRVLLGSVTERTVRSADVPVLTVREE
ncbi:nucleotide-binding universal stress UspA family protein [Halarchaeum rubridurum]|uniref:Nucleotide-binding universal stress UspA family protein n=1 Tax=Halarchaeum rubridurum TaxID=489911 RepID=A0A830G2H4_9EURY|nr:universal stress protein [Halarchaeum rubridurum]MBP1955452.1 nucleotide-binding universal stress UspA family protein [Halarchaeum rubridurum]GGM72482.1 universal stress protein [Halarchaeum rubridurum]